MIKTRLMALLSQAKKYIIQNVFWQWAALLAQIAAVFSAAGLLESAFSGKTEGSVLRRTVLILVLSVVSALSVTGWRRGLLMQPVWM